MSRILRTPSLAMNVCPDLDRVVLMVSGEIDVATIDDLDGAVRQLRAASWPLIVLDLRHVQLIDSTGLAWLVRTARSARVTGWTLGLVDGSAALTRLLEITGTRDLFSWV